MDIAGEKHHHQITRAKHFLVHNSRESRIDRVHGDALQARCFIDD